MSTVTKSDIASTLNLMNTVIDTLTAIATGVEDALSESSSGGSSFTPMEGVMLTTQAMPMGMAMYGQIKAMTPDQRAAFLEIMRNLSLEYDGPMVA